MKLKLWLLLFLFPFIGIRAQTEVIADSAKIDSSTQVNQESVVSSDVSTDDLLPTKYLFTQRMLWGHKGLMRNFSSFKLSEDERDREMQIRHKMITLHRYVGFATLAGMVAQGIVGAKLYNGDHDLLSAHQALAGAVNVGYFSSAALVLFAPPRRHNLSPGYNSLKLHKALAIVHFTTMVATNLLAGQANRNSTMKAMHMATAYTAFGSFLVSMVVVTF